MVSMLLQVLMMMTIANSIPAYVYVGETKGWDEAEAYCLSEYQSHLASIHSAEENAAAVTVCQTGHCWIGYTDRMSEENYVTIDGTPNDYFPGWCSGNPQNNGEEDDCLGIYYMQGGCWFDWYCSGIQKAFVCNPIGSAECDMSQIDKECNNNDECPECMQCCDERGVCEIPPAAKSVLNGINEMNSIYESDSTLATHGSNAFYGYILLVGAVLFILVNNIFIGYWCVCTKRNITQTKTYEKCDVVLD
eukprot:391391_1